MKSLALVLSFLVIFCRSAEAEISTVTANATGNLPYWDGSLRGDVVLYNGQIHTMDAGESIASVIAIENGEIKYIGNSKQDALSGYKSGTPRMVDLKNRMAIPGLIDCHNHMVLFGNRPGFHTPLENAYSISDIQATYKRRAAGVSPHGFITTIGGFNPIQFKENRLPTLAELDAAVPNNPAYIQVGFSGPTVTNSLGKAFFAAQDDPPLIAANGSIATGNETGKALLALRHQLTFADRKRGVLDAMAYAVSLGVTPRLDQGAFQATGAPADGSGHEDNFHMHLPFLSIYNEEKGSVRLRINFLHMDTDITVPAVQQRLLNTFPFFGGDMVRTGANGEFITANYSGGRDFEEAGRRIAAAGWRLEASNFLGCVYYLTYLPVYPPLVPAYLLPFLATRPWDFKTCLKRIKFLSVL